MALLILGPVAALAQPFPNYLPPQYRPFFNHFVDTRSVPERWLNRAGLASGDYGRGFALIAGVSKYPRISGPAGNLEPAAEDVRKLQNYLQTYEKFDEIVVLTDTQVTQENLAFFLEKYFPQRLRDFPKSRFLFAYSGHGTTQNDKGFLLTSGARSLTDTFNSISMITLRAMFQQVVDEGFHVLALINACYSGDFIKRSFGDTHFIPRYSGQHAIVAGGSKELTWHNGSVGTGSVFFEKFFAALEGRAGRDGIVTVDDLAAYLRREVQITTDQRQNPMSGDLSRDGSSGGLFFFNRQPLIEARDLPRWDAVRGVPFGDSLPGESVQRDSPPLQPDENDRQMRERYAALVSRGNTYFSNLNFDSAIADFTEAIRLDPKDASGFARRGTAYNVKKDYDRAIADFTEAIRLDPKYAPPAFNGRGMAYNEKKDYDRAIADFTEGIRLDPKYAYAFNGRGMAYIEQKDYDRAIADFTEAIRLDPKIANAFLYRGVVYENKGDYERAFVDYSETIRLDPRNAHAIVARGTTYGRKGDYDRAIADFNEAIRLEPTNVQAFYFRGLAYSNKRDYDRAISDYSNAIRLNPQYASAFCNRGLAKQAKGDRSGGGADIDRAKQLNPSSCG
jgi:tetratricopeptide (TPR) repeat protein